MDSMMLFKMGFLITISVLRLAVAVPLFLTARRNNLVNLYWLSAQFLALVIAVPFAAIGPLDNRWIFWTFISLTEITLIMFVHTTFRRGRSSPMPFFMALAVIGMFGGAYGTLTGNFTLSAWMVYPNAALAWGWHLGEAARSYRTIASDPNAEDWVKSRYVMMIIYSAVDFVGAIFGTLLTAGVWNSDIGSMLGVGINFTSVIIQILTWVMPEWFRNWLNRDQKTHSEERLREQAQAVLSILGTIMSADTGLSKMMAIFSIRKVIGMQIQSEEAGQIEARAASMGFDEWAVTLNDPELFTLIKNSGLNVNAAEVLEKAKQALIEKQSLFTMKAK